MERARARQIARGHQYSFSAYVTQLIEEDIQAEERRQNSIRFPDTPRTMMGAEMNDSDKPKDQK